jgi:hypothetical protein
LDGSLAFEMNQTERVFAEGDRVDHLRWGAGTVSSGPKKLSSPAKIEGQWTTVTMLYVEVEWDDNKSRGPAECGHLTLRASADCRPYQYYHRQWEPLYEAWKDARMKVENLCSSFRPLPDPDALHDAQEAEAQALAAMDTFWQQERDGLHP